MADSVEISNKEVDSPEPPTKKAKLEESAEETATEAVPNTDKCPDKKDGSGETNKGSKTTGAANNDKQFRGAVREPDVGITEYISDYKGFGGIIKQRFSDFLVNEIDLQKEIVRLTDTECPEKDVEPTDTKTAPSVLTEEWQKQLQTLLDEKDYLAKVELMAGEDKKVRSDIHAAIRQNYSGLDSSTATTKDGQKCITVVYKPQRSREERKRDPWPAGRGNYCHFVLYKENKDTGDAIGVLSKMLRLRPGMFTFAGTKDKRAKTCQRVSVYKVPGSRLHQLNKGLRGMAVGNFRYCDEPLKLGDLQGNHFAIILRSLTGDKEEIDRCMTSLRDRGFLNYYGLQRFGTTSVPTHHVGRALLQSQWSEAVDLILKPREGESDDMNEARTTWVKTKDPMAALQKLRRREGIERTLLCGLNKRSSTDYVGALGELPRNTRLMYVHAYQSYVWNVLASRRISQFGLKVMEGDLVLKQGDKLSSAEKAPTVVTADTLEGVSIHDVVLPLPGWDVVFPENVTGQWYADMLKEDGLSTETLKNKVKDYSLPGDYRHLVVKPGNVKWSVVEYEDVTKSLVLSDLEKLKGDQLPPSEGSNRALRLELSLPSSTYATMALREVLRTDTSASHQASLNKQ